MPTSGENRSWNSVSPKVLKRNTGTFHVPLHTKTLEVAEALIEHGYTDLISVQLTSNLSCKATFHSRDTLTRLCRNGFHLKSVEVRVTQLVPDSVEIQIHDVPIWVQDDVIIESLGVFGSAVGPLRHGFVKTKSGLAIATGIRFATFSLRPNMQIPSYVKTSTNNLFRVRYDGQPATCRKCSQPGHIAADCKLATGTTYAKRTAHTRTSATATVGVQPGELTVQTGVQNESPDSARSNSSTASRPSTSPSTLSSTGCSTSATPVGSNVGEPAVSTEVFETDLNLKTTKVDEGTTEDTSALKNLTDTEPDMSSAQGSLSSMTAHPRTPLTDVEVDIPAERDLERTERLLSEVASNINTEAIHTWFTPERRGRNTSTESSPELATGVKKKDSRKPTNLAPGSRFSPLARV
eukprot:scpid83327/ scgid21880/ 